VVPGFPDRHFDLVEEWIDGDRIAALLHITGHSPR
jgi:hypothetical protein